MDESSCPFCWTVSEAILTDWQVHAKFANVLDAADYLAQHYDGSSDQRLVIECEDITALIGKHRLHRSSAETVATAEIPGKK